MIKEQQQNKKVQYQPKQTLYIHNLNQKIKPKDIKHILYGLFEAYGQILQITCKRNNKMRGQAFIVFKQVIEAATAKNNLNGYKIFGKPMKIQFSAKRSKIVTFTES